MDPSRLSTGASHIPRKFQPPGFMILYEDRDLIVGNKSAGLLSVAAKWNKGHTVHALLNRYIRKGSVYSKKSVFVVHRLDQETTGIMVFAKTLEAQQYLKDHWKDTIKIYYAICHGFWDKKTGTITSYLEEDEDYKIHSTSTSGKGKLARTEYEVMEEGHQLSLMKIRLYTGRKNQIRVHMADQGHPVLGDGKYGSPKGHLPMALHAWSLELTHPFSKKRMTFLAPVPAYFSRSFKYKF